jgi:hypothetical protein
LARDKPGFTRGTTSTPTRNTKAGCFSPSRKRPRLQFFAADRLTADLI